MKIVHALGWYYPESLGGTEVYVAGLSRHLRAAGHEIFIAAPDPHHTDERTYQHEGLPVYRFPIPSQPTREECQGTSPVRGTERFHPWLASQHPDVVHVHTLGTGLGLPELQAAKATGARVIVTTHYPSLGYVCQRGTMMHWGQTLCDGVCQPAKCAACCLEAGGLPKSLAAPIGAIPPGLGAIAQTVPGRIGTALAMSHLVRWNQSRQRQMFEIVDKFVVLTQWALDVVAANGAPRHKLALNRLGLSHAGYSAKPGPAEAPAVSPITVGYLGRFDVVKGVHDLVRAVVSLPRQVALRVELRGPVRTESEHSIARELKALAQGDPRITFAAEVAPAEVLKILAGYDVLCCPSIWLEGGPTVALESQAVGTPVIGTRIGGLAEIVTDGVNGALVKPGDWRALAAILRAMAEDPGNTIDRWRTALPAVRGMDQVAAAYLAMYH